MVTKVKNLNGTGNSLPPYGYSSWLDYWERKSGNKAKDCGRCTSRAEVGAHVKKAYSNDNSWYIVPLCKGCNGKSSDEVFDVYEQLISIP